MAVVVDCFTCGMEFTVLACHVKVAYGENTATGGRFVACTMAKVECPCGATTQLCQLAGCATFTQLITEIQRRYGSRAPVEVNDLQRVMKANAEVIRRAHEEFWHSP